MIIRAFAYEVRVVFIICRLLAREHDTRIATAVLSVRPSVCLLHSCIVSKLLNIIYSMYFFTAWYPRHVEHRAVSLGLSSCITPGYHIKQISGS